MALSAGKAVLCEKPFALCAADANDVINFARKQGLFCMEAMWMRFSPALQEVVSLIRQGKLGKLHFFSGQLGFSYLKSDHERLFRMPGGGALLDLGVYPLSLAQSLFGGSAQAVSVADIGAGGADEQFSVILTYASGAQVLIAASLKTRLANAASIHGESGILHLEEPLYFPEAYRWRRTAPHGTGQRSSMPLALRRLPPVRALAEWKRRAGVKYVSRRSSVGGYHLEAAEVQRCLRQGHLESPVMPWANTLETLQLMDRIRGQWATKLS
jgi:predicted dehydrogenase